MAAQYGSQVDQKNAALTEQLLLQTYKIKLPSIVKEPPNGMGCKKSEAILKLFAPAVLKNYIPLFDIGDGNCGYPSVSRALFCHEEQHLLIRLLSAIEMIPNMEHYDINHPNHIDPTNDSHIITAIYSFLFAPVCKNGMYAGTMHLHAVSAANGYAFHT